MKRSQRLRMLQEKYALSLQWKHYLHHSWGWCWLHGAEKSLSFPGDGAGAGQEQSSVLRWCFGPFPHHKGCVCTAHLQGEWAGSSGKLDIDNFQKPGPARRLKRRQTLAAEKFPGLAQERGSKWINLQTRYIWGCFIGLMSLQALPEPSCQRAVGWVRIKRRCLELFPLGVIMDGESGKAFSRAVIHPPHCSIPTQSSPGRGNLGVLCGKGPWGHPWHGAEPAQPHPTLSTLEFCHF